LFGVLNIKFRKELNFAAFEAPYAKFKKQEKNMSQY